MDWIVLCFQHNRVLYANGECPACLEIGGHPVMFEYEEYDRYGKHADAEILDELVLHEPDPDEHGDWEFHRRKDYEREEETE